MTKVFWFIFILVFYVFVPLGLVCVAWDASNTREELNFQRSATLKLARTNQLLTFFMKEEMSELNFLSERVKLLEQTIKKDRLVEK